KGGPPLGVYSSPRFVLVLVLVLVLGRSVLRELAGSREPRAHEERVRRPEELAVGVRLPLDHAAARDERRAGARLALVGEVAHLAELIERGPGGARDRILLHRRFEGHDDRERGLTDELHDLGQQGNVLHASPHGGEHPLRLPSRTLAPPTTTIVARTFPAH